MQQSNSQSFFKTGPGKVVITIVVYAVYFLLISGAGALMDMIPNTGDGDIAEGVFTAFSMTVAVVWGISGWKSLRVITPDIFLIMPLVGWVIYFMLKGLLSLVVGIFTLPLGISKFIISRI